MGTNNNKGFYEAPAVMVVEVKVEGVVCLSSWGDNPTEDFGFGDLDELP